MRLRGVVLLCVYHYWGMYVTGCNCAPASRCNYRFNRAILSLWDSRVLELQSFGFPKESASRSITTARL